MKLPNFFLLPGGAGLFGLASVFLSSFFSLLGSSLSGTSLPVVSFLLLSEVSLLFFFIY
jgi:hypothetical protein